MAQGSGRARIGMVNFINTAPLYEVWKRTVKRPEWQVFEAPPTTLNRMLAGGELDLGFISSHEYGLHPERYKILSDLSISASGPVGSVLLCCWVAPEELNGRDVLLTAQSQTSASLVKIVLEEFYGVKPVYHTGAVLEMGEGAAIERFDALLVIGDEALRLAASDAFLYQLDLAEIWQLNTGLPFVFAVWAVREEFCRTAPETVVAIHQEMLRCIIEGERELDEISRRVAPRIPMQVERCYEYLKGLEYDLDETKQAALARFFDYLIRRGEIPAAALPLKICG